MATQVGGQVQLRCFDSETLCVHSASSALIPASCVCACVCTHVLMLVRLIQSGKKGFIVCVYVCVGVCLALCDAAEARRLAGEMSLVYFI